MFRKLILSAVLATGTIAGLAATSSTASAAEGRWREEDRRREEDRWHRRFEILVECRGCWENRGTYRDRFDAERAASHFRREGFRVQVREF
jgi:hypothetical protein